MCMEITEAQYARIRQALPVQRGNVSLTNLQLLNALLYVFEHAPRAGNCCMGSARCAKAAAAGEPGL